MASVEISRYLNDYEDSMGVTIDMDSESEVGSPYSVTIPDGWYTESDLNEIIKTLQKAKRIFKTRTIKKGD